MNRWIDELQNFEYITTIINVRNPRSMIQSVMQLQTLIMNKEASAIANIY